MTRNFGLASRPASAGANRMQTGSTGAVTPPYGAKLNHSLSIKQLAIDVCAVISAFVLIAATATAIGASLFIALFVQL